MVQLFRGPLIQNIPYLGVVIVDLCGEKEGPGGTAAVEQFVVQGGVDDALEGAGVAVLVGHLLDQGVWLHRLHGMFGDVGVLLVSQALPEYLKQ